MRKKFKKVVASSICALFLINSIPIAPAFAEEVIEEQDQQLEEILSATDTTPTEVVTETIDWSQWETVSSPLASGSGTSKIQCDMIIDEMGDTQCVQSSSGSTTGNGSVDPLTSVLIGLAGQYLNKDNNNQQSPSPQPIEQEQTAPVASGTWENLDLSTITPMQDDGSYSDQEIQGGFGLEGWGLGLLGGIPISDNASYSYTTKGPGGAIVLAKVSPKNPLVGDTVQYGVVVQFAKPNCRVFPPIAYATETYDKVGIFGKDFYFQTLEIVYKGHYAYPRYGYVKVHVNVKVSEVGASGSTDGSGTGQYTGTDGTGNTGTNTGGTIDLGTTPNLPNYGGSVTGSTNNSGELDGSSNFDNFLNNPASNNSNNGTTNGTSSDPWSLDGTNSGINPINAQTTLDSFYGENEKPISSTDVGTVGTGGYDANGNPVSGGAYNADGTLANNGSTGNNGNVNTGYNGSSSSGNSSNADRMIGSNGESSNSANDDSLNKSLFGKIESAVTGMSGGLFGSSKDSSGSSVASKFNSLVGGITGGNSETNGKGTGNYDTSASTDQHNTSVASAITEAEQLMQIAKNLGMTPSYDSGSAWTDPDDSWDLNRVSKILKAKQALNVVQGTPTKTNTTTNKTSQPALPTQTTTQNTNVGALPTQKK